MNDQTRRNILIDSASGPTIVLQLEGRKLVGVSDRVALNKLIAECPTLPAALTAAPQGKENILRFFGKGPCYFKGCDELRAEYNTAVETTVTASCPPCKKSAIMRRFIPMIEAALLAEPKENSDV